jgi:hypothetical protein
MILALECERAVRDSCPPRIRLIDGVNLEEERVDRPCF